MQRPVLAMTLTAALAFASLGAEAHPGSKILTLGGGAERSAMTPGMTYEDVNGVHIFRGARALAGEEPALAGGPEGRQIEIEIEKHVYVWRRLRHMRTQGFYSGDRYPSRRYTQGFYSGQ
jgi:hypothetical protein